MLLSKDHIVLQAHSSKSNHSGDLSVYVMDMVNGTRKGIWLYINYGFNNGLYIHLVHFVVVLD